MDKIPSTAVELDIVLRNHITRYYNNGGSTRKLTVGITEFMRNLYQPILSNATNEEERQAILTDLERNTPSRTYLRMYHDGENVCTRYINAIALFFGQKYQITQYDPAEVWAERKELTKKSTLKIVSNQ